MKRRILASALTAAVLLLGANLACALDAKAAAASSGASAAQTSMQAKPKPATRAALVDINSAGSKELKTLPGINDADAAKIIAGRPYGSKAQLVTHNILDAGVYEGIKSKIIARQPYKDGAKNAAIYTKRK